MKKWFLIPVFAFCLLGNMQAGNGNNIQQLIGKQLHLPAQLKKEKINEKVSVEFHINDNGKVSVLKVNTDNKTLEHAVQEQFNKMDFSQLQEGKSSTYFIDINFRVL